MRFMIFKLDLINIGQICSIQMGESWRHYSPLWLYKQTWIILLHRYISTFLSLFSQHFLKLSLMMFFELFIKFRVIRIAFLLLGDTFNFLLFLMCYLIEVFLSFNWIPDFVLLCNHFLGTELLFFTFTRWRFFARFWFNFCHLFLLPMFGVLSPTSLYELWDYD